MKTFRFPRWLTASTWEEQFTGRRYPWKAKGGWKHDYAREGFRLDFTKVEFAEVGALAHALLVLDSAVTAGIRAEVVLPTAALFPGEQAHLDELAGRQSASYQDALRRFTRHARLRAEAVAFMRDLGFIDALQAAHWPARAVKVSEADVLPSELAIEDPRGDGTDRQPPHPQYSLRRIIPFRWIDVRDDDTFTQSAFDRALAEFKTLGLSDVDARTLSSAVVTKLLKNVSRHAGPPGDKPPRALFAAVFLNADTYVLRRSDSAGRVGELLDLVRETGSGVLRLLVGDSGVGIVNGLVAAHPEGGGKSTVGLVENREPTKSEDTVFLAFDRWSTSVGQRDPGRLRHRSGGLWRVARLVRSYRGTIQVRTGDVMIEQCFAQRGDPIRCADRVEHMPGTLVGVDVLIDPLTPRMADTDDDGASWLLGDYPIEVVTVAFDQHHGLSEADQMALTEAARRAELGGGPSGLVAVIREPHGLLSDWTTQTALRKVLGIAGVIANPTAVAVVLPNADPRVLDLSINSINDDEPLAAHAPEWHGFRSPVLVMGAHGKAMWCGGSAPLRELVEALTAAGGALGRREADECWAAAGGDPRELQLIVRDQQHLLASANGRLTLPMPVRAVLEKLSEKAAERLVGVIEAGGRGVERGYFRTPTLRRITRWLNVDDLLAGTFGTHLAALLLARYVDERLRFAPRVPAQLVVAQVGNVSRELTSQLSECLGLGGRCYAMPGELDLDGLPPGEGVPSGARVVLCTDELSTENTARRAAAAIIGANATPVAIACVVDARLERGRPVEMFNRSIPVISLCEADIDPGAEVREDELVEVDPILRRPLPVKAEPGATHVVPESQFLEWCLEPGVLRLGHVERPPRVHFSTYLQLNRLLQNENSWLKVTEAMITVVKSGLAAWRSSVPDPRPENPRIQIWHPDGPTDYAGKLADAVRLSLSQHGYSVEPNVWIPRAVARDRWTFPETFSDDADVDCVVVVDWGALSATTVQQMVRLASRAGPGAIIVVILLNQLADQDAEALAIQRTVQSSRTGRFVPVVVRFVTASSITALPAHDCSMCVMHDDYARYARSAPGRLAKHAEKLHEMTRRRSRDELFRATPTDLFHVPVNGDDVTGYLRWRGLLRQALRVTSARHEVVERLAVLPGDRGASGTWNRHSLIRLLAAERHWLKLPPLRFAAARTHLADMCRAVLSDSPALFERLRMQALMVLAVSVPEKFVEWLPDLLSMVVDQNLLIDQMLLDCHRLLRRSPHDSPVDMEQLRISLIRSRNLLEDLPIGTGGSAVDEHLRVLRDLIAIADRHERREPVDAQTAWGRLREMLMRSVQRHGMDADLVRVRGFVEDLQDCSPESAGGLDPLTDWETCSSQIDERALVSLRTVRDIIAGDYVAGRVGEKDHRRILRLLKTDAPVRVLQDVGERLFQIMHEPWQPDSPRWVAQRQELLNRLNWWYRVFVATHQPGKDRPAVLVELISSAPCELHERIQQVKAKRGESVEFLAPSGDWRVFCPDKLLDQIVDHLFDNAHRHLLPGASCRFSVEYVRRGGTTVQVVVRNTGSRPRQPSGQGLRSLNEHLQPFGGHIHGTPLAGSEWTFAVTMTLQLWRGV